MKKISLIMLAVFALTNAQITQAALSLATVKDEAEGLESGLEELWTGAQTYKQTADIHKAISKFSPKDMEKTWSQILASAKNIFTTNPEMATAVGNVVINVSDLENQEIDKDKVDSMRDDLRTEIKKIPKTTVAKNDADASARLIRNLKFYEPVLAALTEESKNPKKLNLDQSKSLLFRINAFKAYTGFAHDALGIKKSK